MHALFRERAAAHPQRIALVWDEGRLDYAGLDARSDALAARLVALGVGADTPVAVCLARSPEAVVALLAVLKAGAAYLPLDAGHPRERLRFAIADAGATVLLTDAAQEACCRAWRRNCWCPIRSPRRCRRRPSTACRAEPAAPAIAPT